MEGPLPAGRGRPRLGRHDVKKQIVSAVCLAVACTVLLPAAAFAISSEGSTVRPHAAVTLSSQEKLLVSLINKERTKRGLAAVKVQLNLMRAARSHSTEMALKRYFSHNSRNGESFAARLIRFGYKRTGYRSWLAGEDLYYGTGLLSSPVAAVRAWMKSPGIAPSS